MQFFFNATQRMPAGQRQRLFVPKTGPLILALLVSLLCACGYSKNLRVESQNIRVYAKPKEKISPTQMQALVTTLEREWKQMQELLKIKAKRTLIVHLKTIDSSMESNAIENLPHVNENGEVQLIRDKPHEAFTIAIAHEFVHALRFPQYRKAEKNGQLPPWNEFIEEGFATAMAAHSRNDSAAFPYFGFPLESLGLFLAKRNQVPLASLRQQSGYKFMCVFDIYLIRGAFFAYLLKKFPTETKQLLDRGDKEISAKDFIDLYQAPIETLYKEWQSHSKHSFTTNNWSIFKEKSQYLIYDHCK